jgi:polar amino acid transport system permease protein
VFNAQLMLDSLPLLAQAAIVTIKLTVLAGIFSLVFGTLSAMAQLSGLAPLKWLSRAYVSLMRGTPLFVQLLVVFFTLPMLGINNAAFEAAVIAIGLNSGAYVTEIVRGAITAVPTGHVEAAEAVGLSKSTIWRKIVLPQAFKTCLPALTTEMTIVLKSTPLASVISVTELTYTGVLIQSRAFSAIEIFLPIAVGYILIAQVLLRLSRYFEARLSLRG